MSLRAKMIMLSLVLTTFAAACGDSSNPAATSTSALPPTTTQTIPEITLPPVPPRNYAEFREQPTACASSAPQEIVPKVFAEPEDQGLDANAPVAATITTSCGDIQLELDPSIAPETVNSFVFLVRAGYFDGTVSHRVSPGFVMQAGDPTATGFEGPGYTIPDELPPEGFLYEAGTLAMANSGPNSSGSQFFIMLADAPLPPAYSVFGSVVGGLDTLASIANIPLGPNPRGEVSVPLETLYIEQITVDE